MSRAYSVNNIIDAKFNVMDFTGEWLAACGKPEVSGTFFIYGPPKNGKTSFAMKLSKYLTNFGRVMYHPVEEKLSLSLKAQIERVGMIDVKTRFVCTSGYEIVTELAERLSRHKSPDIVVIDSIQFWGITWDEYKQLKKQFPNKVFIYISHIEGRQPEGNTARRIWRDANIAFRVEGFRAFPVGRYGGGETIDINKQMANDYWGLKI